MGKTPNFILSLLLICSLALFLCSCGNKKAVDTEAFVQLEEEVNGISENDGDGMHKDLYRYFGVEEGVDTYVDSLDLSNAGENFHVDINANIFCPPLEGMRIYSMKKDTMLMEKEQDILNAFFDKGSVEEVHDAICDEIQSQLINIYGLDAFGFTYNYDEVNGTTYWEEQDIPGWSEFENILIHTYEGTRNGNTYQMVLSADSDGDNLRAFIQVASIIDMYEEYQEMFSKQDSFQFLNQMNLEVNGDSKVDEYDENALNIENAEKIIQELLQIFELEEQEIECYNSLYLVNIGETFQKISCDGYEYYLQDTSIEVGDCTRFIPNTACQDLPRNRNEGNIVVSSKGIVSAYLYKCTKIDAGESYYVDMLSLDKIKGIMRDVIDSDFDPEMVFGKQITFDYLALCYYYVSDSNDADAYAYIPVWILRAKDNKYESKCSIIVNAIDGSLIDILYEKD